MLFTTVFAAAVAGTAMAAPVLKERKQPPAGWATGYLEDYQTYHARYLALDCQDQHNTTFFDDCCHPMLATENLTDNRPSYCTPNATALASASSVVANATATVTSSIASATDASDADDSDDAADDSDVESEWCSATEAVYDSVSATATSSIDTTSYSVPTTTSTWSAAATSTSAAASIVADANYAHQHSSSSTSAWVAPTTTWSSAATATSTASSSSGSGQTMTGGYATFFYQGGNAGECGTVHSDSEYGIAIDAAGWWSDYESNSDSPYCGKQIVITNTNNGKTVTATVWDVCPTCDTNNSLDLSVGAFTAIASESDGMVPITWQWA